MPSRFYSQAHQGEFVVDVLKGMTVRDIWKAGPEPPVSFPFDCLLARVMELIPTTTQSVFPVLDRQGRYAGFFGLNQIRRLIYEKEAGNALIAEDVVGQNVRALHPDTDLSTVVVRFAQLEHDELPVVDADTRKVLGILRRQDILSAYSARMAEMQGGGA